MGYEVLDAGGDAARPGDDRAAGTVWVLDLDGATPPQAPARHGASSRRCIAAVATLTVLALGALAGHAGGASAPAPSQLTGPAPTATTPGTLLSEVTDAENSTRTGLPLSRSTDLTTTITVGHSRVPGQSVERQIATLQRALATRAVNASYVFEPDPAPAGTTGPVGVRVVFNRRLSDDAWSSARDALNEVDPATSRLETVTGTTVDISLPIRLRAACFPFTRPQSSARLAMNPTDTFEVLSLLGSFGMRIAEGRAVITYVGAFRSRTALTRAGAVLARACGGSIARVTYTRGRLGS